MHTSVEAYRAGRAHAFEYVSGDRHAVVSPYFRALSCFESCISNSWQVCEIIVKASEGKPVFSTGDGSDFERLHSIYTYGLKHSIGKYDASQHGEMPTSVWLTDTGIACVSGATLTYGELIDFIGSGDKFFYDLRKTIVEKRNKVSRLTA